MNEQVKAGIAALKDFLGGHSTEESSADLILETAESHDDSRQATDTPKPLAGTTTDDPGPSTGEAGLDRENKESGDQVIAHSISPAAEKTTGDQESQRGANTKGRPQTTPQTSRDNTVSADTDRKDKARINGSRDKAHHEQHHSPGNGTRTNGSDKAPEKSAQEVSGRSDRSEPSSAKARSEQSSLDKNESSSVNANNEQAGFNEKETNTVKSNSDPSEGSAEDPSQQRQSDKSAGDQERHGQPDSSAQDQEGKQKSVDDASFEAAVEILRAAGPSAERAAAARALGLQGSQRGTPHLIAAMFDDDPDVRTAAEEALGKLGEPTFKQSSAADRFDQSTETLSQPDAPKAAAPESTTEKSKMMQPPSNAQPQASVAPPAKSVVAQPPKKEAAHAHRKSETADSHKETAQAKREGAAGHTATASAGHVAPQQARSERQSAASGAAAGEATDAARKKATEQSRAAAFQNGAPQKGKPAKTELLTAPGPDASEDEQQLFLEERATLQRLALIEQQLLEKTAARTEAENQAQWRRERESKLLAEAAAQRLKEEDLRKKAEEEAAERRKKEAEAIAVEQTARAKADVDAERLAASEVRIRGEIAKLSRAAEELRQRRIDVESARLSAAAAARQHEAQRVRDEADRAHKAELERLHNEQAMLEAATEKATARRAEVHAARERAEKDAEALAQAQARMRDAEDSRIKAEAERVKLEAELHLKVETEEALLAAARQRAEDEQARLEEEARRHRESEELRMADLEAARKQAEFEGKQRAEREQQIRSQLDTLRIADAEVRKRIEDAEVRRRAAEEAFRLVAEKVQRIETEAHASKLEEEQILSKLEAARRNAAVEAQARAEQERRIKEEIEMFRRLEDEERPRLEELMLQRSAAESRLHETRERFRSEEEARVRAEEQIENLEEYKRGAAEPELAETPLASGATVYHPVAEARAITATEQAALDVGVPTAPEIPAAISSYLHSVDPYKRAAAVAELARSHTQDAFALITRSFDDPSTHVRNAAARALRKLEPQKSVDLFNRALEESSSERRKNIGAAIAASGLASEAINSLIGDNREETYNALSILFVMAKTGEVQPLVQAVEEHENEEVCRAVIKLLTLSGQSELGDAALQRRVMGVAASRQKTANKHDEIPDFRLRIAEVEVKRALKKSDE